MGPDEIDYKQAAIDLWDLLDDIDTLDDMCKGNAYLFRNRVREVVRLRFSIASSDGYDITFIERETVNVASGR